MAEDLVYRDSNSIVRNGGFKSIGWSIRKIPNQYLALELNLSLLTNLRLMLSVSTNSVRRDLAPRADVYESH